MYSRLQELTEIEDFEVGDAPVSFFDFVGADEPKKSGSAKTGDKQKVERPAQRTEKDFKNQSPPRFFDSLVGSEQQKPGNVQVLYNRRSEDQHKFRKEGGSSSMQQRKSPNRSISFQQRKFSKDVQSMMDIFKK